MQVEIFNPVDVYAAVTESGCFLSGHEQDRAGGFGLHFDDADALGAFGIAVIEEARRLIREQAQKALTAGLEVALADNAARDVP